MPAPTPTATDTPEPSDPRIHEAIQLMMGFAERTGLTSDRPQQRYLWTDAFAVCNFLGLARVTGEERYAELGLRLVDRVHHLLGRHRADDSRAGWISGLGEAAGMAHPTRGGLRIGKKLPERRPGEAFDEALEWERDGQYFHYLTKWMHALDQVSRSTRQPRFNLWARELAEAAFGAFSYLPRGGRRPRMVWKMSIDLSRPLVPSMGQHDPLDGFITCAALKATASELATEPEGPSLEQELSGFAGMVEGGDWATADPLGIGGLLMDACRVEQLMGQDAVPDGDVLCALLAAALEGLGHYAQQNDLQQPASRRLGFRELGLSIGLRAVERIELGVQAEPERFAAGADLRALLGFLRPYVSLGPAIESFWLDPEHRQAPAWSGHRDINEVMLATSLSPEGFLVLSPMEKLVVAL
jgi:hypothetical protein